MPILAVVVATFLTTDQRVLIIISFISGFLGPVGVVVAGALFARHSNALARRVQQTVLTASGNVGTKVDNLHREMKPPSNGTPAGAYIEGGSVQNGWLYEELLEINKALGRQPHSPFPTIPQVEPPPRPASEEGPHDLRT